MDADSAGQFEAACSALVASGALHLVIDLGGLAYVSSFGLGAIMAAAKAREASKGTLVLVQLRGFVKQVFDLTRLTPLFRNYDTVEQALQSLS